MQPPPLNEASEVAYERLTSELKSRVVTMWQELQEEELRGKDSREQEENAKSSARVETAHL